jgi:iron complex outermembrane recepter protein
MLHKIKALILLALIFPLWASGQFSFKGRIIDQETNQPLPGAHIKLSNLMLISQNDGSFLFSNLKSDVYQLEISYLGYSTLKTNLEIKADLNRDFILKLSAVISDEVVITAYRANDKTGTSFTNLTKAEIKKADAGMDIPYLLDMTPGLITNSDAGAGVGYTSMRIRGSDLTRINVTINGIPLNDPESQGAWFVDLPDLAASLNSIQIQRGVGTSVNGSAAFGATIDLQTQGLEAEPFSEVSMGYGSFNTQRYRVAASTGLMDDKYSFDVRLSSITSDGFIDRASSDLKSFFVSGARYGKNSILRFNVFSGHQITYQAWNGIPKDSLKTNRTYNPYTYQNEVDDYTQTHYQLHYTYKINKNWILNSALHYTQGFGFYENYKENGSLSGYGIEPFIIGIDTISETNLVQQKWLDNDFYGFTFNANYFSEKWNMVLGGALNQFQGRHFGEIIWSQYALMGNNFEWYRNNGLKTDLNIYGKATYLFSENLNFYGDIQFRNVNYSMEGLHDDLHDLTSQYSYAFFNPKAGLVYKFNDSHELYGSYAIGNKEPSRNNYRDADIGYIPQPEHLKDYEFGYAFTHQKALARINFYYMDYQNQLVETGKVNNVGSPIMTNVAKSYRAGTEIIVGWQPNKKINWNFNVTLSHNKILSFTEFVDNWDNWSQESKYLGTTDISFSPNTILKNSFEYLPFQNFTISLQSRFVSRQYIDNTSNLSRSIDPYFVNDLIFNYQPKIKGLKNLNLNFKINNILNEEYETSAWVYRYRTGGEEFVLDGYFPQAGINFTTGLSLKF